MFKRSGKYKLAAVVFMDIVGYTTMMESDETATVEKVKKHRAITEEAVSRFNGKLVQYFGDGCLAIFPGATEAVCFGQEMLQKSTQSISLSLRIGVHLGEILVDGDQVYGDAINVAFRIQSVADADTMFVSQMVADMVQNKDWINIVDRGHYNLKNVSNPLRIYQTSVSLIRDQVPVRIKRYRWYHPLLALLLIIMVWFGYTEWSVKQANQSIEKTVAVLPYSLGPGESQSDRYLAQGLQIMTIRQLSMLKDLNVITKEAIETVLFDTIDLSDMTDVLNARYLLRGNIRKLGHDFVLEMDLYDGREKRSIWENTYTSSTAELFDMQTRVISDVIDAFAVNLKAEDMSAILTPPTNDLKAFELYIQGTQSWFEFYNRRDPLKFELAITYFNDALKIDSSFALAYAGLCNSFFVKYYWDRENHPDKMDTIKMLGEKVMRLNPNLPEAYYILGNYHYLVAEDAEKAMELLSYGFELNPNSTDIIRSLVRVYQSQGKQKEALALLKKAALIDAGSNLAYWYIDIGWVFQYLGDFERAAVYFKRSRDINPDYVQVYAALNMSWMVSGQYDSLGYTTEELERRFPEHEITYYWLGVTNMLKNDYERALDHFETLAELPPEMHRFYSSISKVRQALVLKKLGQNDKANQILKEQELKLSMTSDPSNYYELAGIHVMQGEWDKGMSYLKSFDQHGWLAGLEYFISKDPLFDALHGDVVFNALVENAIARKESQRNVIQYSND